MLVTECASLISMATCTCLDVSASCFLISRLTAMLGGAGTCRVATSSRCVRKHLGMCFAVIVLWHTSAGCPCWSPDRALPSSGNCARHVDIGGGGRPPALWVLPHTCRGQRRSAARQWAGHADCD